MIFRTFFKCRCVTEVMYVMFIVLLTASRNEVAASSRQPCLDVLYAISKGPLAWIKATRCASYGI